MNDDEERPFYLTRRQLEVAIRLDFSGPEMRKFIRDIKILNAILHGDTEPQISFSLLTESDIEEMGLIQGWLKIDTEELSNLASRLTPYATLEIQSLQTRLLDIRNHVNMDCDASAHMMFDAVLQSVAKIISHESDQTGMSVAIFPDLHILPGSQINHPLASLNEDMAGVLDYLVIQYKNDNQTRAKLLRAETRRYDAFKFAHGLFFLVEVKGQRGSRNGFIHQDIPKAVGQAMTVAKLARRNEVNFCVTNLNMWYFIVLKKDDDSRWRHYETLKSFHLYGEIASTDVVREIVLVVSELLAPTLGLNLFKPTLICYLENSH